MSLQPKTYEAALARRKQGKRSQLKRKGLRAKHDPKMAAWSKAVLDRDGHQCQAFRFKASAHGVFGFDNISCCDRIDPHHIAERSLRPDLKYDVDNGIALCRWHHDWVPMHRADAIKLGLLSDETYEAAQKAK